MPVVLRFKLVILFSALVLFIANRTATADVLHGIGDIGDGGASGSTTGKYPGMLQATRGLNFGGVGTPYNFAAIGATSASVLTPGNQIQQLVTQVQAGNVTLAFMSVGDNDFFSGTTLTSIANGTATPAVLTAFETSLANNIKSGVDSVLAAGAKVVLGGISDIVHSPIAASINADPVQKARVEAALSAVDNLLIAYAASKSIAYIDFFALEKAVFDSGHFQVGGVNISLTTVGTDPHNFFQDNLNAGVVIRAEIANLWLQGTNMAYGTSVPLLSDLEILTLAGIGNEYQHETFLAAQPLAQYVPVVPEPSSVALAGIGITLLIGRGCQARARRRLISSRRYSACAP